MKLKFFLFFILVFISFLDAQSDRVSGKIRGRVLDSMTKEPLIGANVLLLPTETSRGTMTNENGEFQKGSIGPKIKAAMHFLKYHGNKVVITSIPWIKDAINGNAGTIIRND